MVVMLCSISRAEGGILEFLNPSAKAGGFFITTIERSDEVEKRCC